MALKMMDLMFVFEVSTLLGFLSFCKPFIHHMGCQWFAISYFNCRPTGLMVHLQPFQLNSQLVSQPDVAIDQNSVCAAKIQSFGGRFAVVERSKCKFMFHIAMQRQIINWIKKLKEKSKVHFFVFCFLSPLLMTPPKKNTLWAKECCTPTLLLRRNRWQLLFENVRVF